MSDGMGRRRQFTALAIARVPAGPLAYVLLRGAAPLYAGVAAGGATLRRELAAHLRGEFGTAGRAPTHFSYELCPDALHAYCAQVAIMSAIKR
jgi:hypothetical protein